MFKNNRIPKVFTAVQVLRIKWTSAMTLVSRLRWVRSLLTFSIVMAFAACTQVKEKNKYPTATIVTEVGDITVELYPDRAPLTVENFLRNADSGVFDGSNFYRILRIDRSTEDQPQLYNSVQAGIMLSGKERPPKIPHETSSRDLRHTNGVISMARLAPGTATSEFFFSVGDNPGFDYKPATADEPEKPGYATFGRVIEGWNVVLKIYDMPTGGSENENANILGKTVITKPVEIRRIETKVAE